MAVQPNSVWKVVAIVYRYRPNRECCLSLLVFIALLKSCSLVCNNFICYETNKEVCKSNRGMVGLNRRQLPCIRWSTTIGQAFFDKLDYKQKSATHRVGEGEKIKIGKPNFIFWSYNDSTEKFCKNIASQEKKI